MMTRIQVEFNQQRAEQLLREWQGRLQLQDWLLKVKIVRGNGLDLPVGVQGRCEWVLARREALIKLLNPIDWDPAITWPQDMEATLVHELVHVHLAPIDTFDIGSLQHTAMEQAVYALAHALVDAKRTYWGHPRTPVDAKRTRQASR
jgi:hypothetical protein